MALVHFVCFAWPGAGGRVAAMRLWGRWHQPDISAQLASVALRPSAAPRPLGPRSATAKPPLPPAPRPRPFGLDAHSWLRACGLACGYGDCEEHNQHSDARPRLRLCAEWLHQTTWRVSPLRAWVREQQKKREKEGRDAEGGEHPPLAQASLRKGDLGGELGGELEAQIRREASEMVAVPPDLAAATSRAAARHPAALVAFRRPLVVADRREYQLYVHLLHSAAMLSGRRPVLPLAHCNQAPTAAIGSG